MAITSIFINGELPVIANMKTLDDFIISNFFKDLPSTDATPFAGFYFGERTTDITINSFDSDVPATVKGTLSNASGYISVGITNYLDTMQTAPVALTMGASFRRPPVPTVNTWLVSDYSSTDGVGFAFGVSTNGKLILGSQVAGSGYTATEIDFPSSIAVGDMCGVTCFIRNGTITVAVYNPTTDAYVSSAVAISGTRLAGAKNILIGCKHDNNTSTSTLDVKAVLLMNGSLTTAQHVAVQKYLIAM